MRRCLCDVSATPSLSGPLSKGTACEGDTAWAPHTKQMQNLPGIDILQNPWPITEVEPWWWMHNNVRGVAGGWQVHFSRATYSMNCCKRKQNKQPVLTPARYILMFCRAYFLSYPDIQGALWGNWTMCTDEQSFAPFTSYANAWHLHNQCR